MQYQESNDDTKWYIWEDWKGTKGREIFHLDYNFKIIYTYVYKQKIKTHLIYIILKRFLSTQK